MPRYGQTTPAATTPGAGRYTSTAPAAAPQGGEDGGGISPLAAAGIAAAAGAGALALHKPALAKKAVDTVLAARYVPMLSGFALPKSIAGNVGAALTSAAERRSLTPLLEFFSPATVKEFGAELMNPTARGSGQVIQQAGRYNPIGRVMGAADAATQGALRRAGLSAPEAAEATLQTPVPSQYAKPLSTTLGRVLVPFQRTGFNQLFGGLRATAEHPGIAAAAAGAGAATGAASEDTMTPGLVSPLAGRYGLPFIIGAAAGRKYLAGKPDTEAARVAFGLSPTSDEGMIGPVLDPAKPFVRPSLLSMLKYFGLE